MPFSIVGGKFFLSSYALCAGTFCSVWNCTSSLLLFSIFHFLFTNFWGQPFSEKIYRSISASDPYMWNFEFFKITFCAIKLIPTESWDNEKGVFEITEILCILSMCLMWEGMKSGEFEITDDLGPTDKKKKEMPAFSESRHLKQGFWYFARSQSREIQANPRNPAKFTKTRKILRNSVEILSNTCLYSNFETCLSYWGYLLAVNSQIYVKTSSLKHRNNVPKLPG